MTPNNFAPATPAARRRWTTAWDKYLGAAELYATATDDEFLATYEDAISDVIATPAPDLTAWVEKASLYIVHAGGRWDPEARAQMMQAEELADRGPAHLMLDMERLNGEPFHYSPASPETADQ
jgi:hypothetical protein